MLILAFILGPTGIIWSILNQKGANRKLVVEEGDLEVNEFSALTQTYKDLLSRSTTATEAAVKAAEAAVVEVKQASEQRKVLQEELDEVRETQRRLRALFTRVIARYNIKLTEEEEAEFESTRLRRRGSA